MAGQNHHDYHLVDPSYWPILGALGLFLLPTGAVMMMHSMAYGAVILAAGTLVALYVMFGWWKDVVNEGSQRPTNHSKVVRHGLRVGMALFIASEVMFFFAFFWSFFKAALDPVFALDGVWPTALTTWPPEGIVTFDAFDIPFINTLVLLLSGTTVTWAHHALLHNNKEELVKALTITVALGAIFSCLQAYEYHHAQFGFTDGIYSSNFYMATGFHGFHVLVGTIFLAVCLFRAKKGQFSKNHHLGFEFAAWYWHFVDVVWLFLFIFVYWWGGS